jgi:hypothetical protein
MATATVYTINDNDEIVEQFDCDYNFAIGEYWGKPNLKGRFYIARKGVSIPYQMKKTILKNVNHQSSQQDQEQSS